MTAALVVTPDNQKSPIDVDDRDDSATFSSILLNDDNKEGGITGDDGMDDCGPNNESSIVPKTGSNSTENEVATTGGVLSSNIPPTNDDTGNNDTGDKVMSGVNSEVIVVNKDGSADSKSTNEAIKRIQEEILDLEYLIETSTGDTTGTPPEDLLSGGALNVTNAELLQLQHLLEEEKNIKTSDKCPNGGSHDDIVIVENTSNVTGKPFAIPKSILGSHEIGGSDTINVLANQVLISNTTSNALSSIRVGTIDNTVTPMWKYSQHQQRLASIASIPKNI